MLTFYLPVGRQILMSFDIRILAAKGNPLGAREVPSAIQMVIA